MGSPTISIYLSAIRPQLWQRMYDSLSLNNVSFEIIFVGDVSPTFTLPDNCCHIYSPVKPTQCAEIGFRACTGEFCLFASDDMIFQDHCLDILIDRFRSTGREDIAVSCMHKAGGKIIPLNRCKFIPGRADSPNLPMAAIYKTEVYHSLGPRDRNFVCTYADLDVAMRLYERGGITIYVENCVVEEILIPGTTVDMYDTGLNWLGKDIDWPLVCDLWMENNVFLTNRKRPVEPFVEEGLLIESQGRKGHPNRRWP